MAIIIIVLVAVLLSVDCLKARNEYLFHLNTKTRNIPLDRCCLTFLYFNSWFVCQRLESACILRLYFYTFFSSWQFFLGHAHTHTERTAQTHTVSSFKFSVSVLALYTVHSFARSSRANSNTMFRTVLYGMNASIRMKLLPANY